MLKTYKNTKRLTLRLRTHPSGNAAYHRLSLPPSLHPSLPHPPSLFPLLPSVDSVRVLLMLPVLQRFGDAMLTVSSYLCVLFVIYVVDIGRY